MQLVFKAKHFKLTKKIKKYIQNKLLKFDRSLPKSTFVEINLEDIYGPKGGKDKKVHLSVDIPGEKFIHLEEKTSDIFVSIDMVIKKFARQTRKIKSKNLAKRGQKIRSTITSVVGWIPSKIASRIRPQKSFEMEVVKRKEFNLSNPLNEEEAISEMNKLGHDFYYFKNKSTNKLTIVYRRKRGGYGTIEPKQ